MNIKMPDTISYILNDLPSKMCIIFSPEEVFYVYEWLKNFS